MVEKNQALFKKFKLIHDTVWKNPQKISEEFHTVGLEVTDTVRFWERKLCSGMERGKFAQYSQGLSEKFWQVVKKDFPLIDQVGVKTKK